MTRFLSADWTRAEDSVGLPGSLLQREGRYFCPSRLPAAWKADMRLWPQLAMLDTTVTLKTELGLELWSRKREGALVPEILLSCHTSSDLPRLDFPWERKFLCVFGSLFLVSVTNSQKQLLTDIST